MKILGLDPGLERTGWAILEQQRPRPRVLACGLIKTDSTLDLSRRLVSIHDQLGDILRLHQPEKAIIEELFFTTNVKTAMVVGQARGVILLTLAEGKVPCEAVTPSALKLALTGHGNAKKEQIQKMLPALCEMFEPVFQDDTADAIALAWYGCK